MIFLTNCRTLLAFPLSSLFSINASLNVHIFLTSSSSSFSNSISYFFSRISRICSAFLFDRKISYMNYITSLGRFRISSVEIVSISSPGIQDQYFHRILTSSFCFALSRVDSLRFHIDPEPSFRILWMGKLKQQIIANLTVRYLEILYILADHFIRCWIRIQPIINLVLSI